MQDTTERTIIISAVWMAALAFACSLALADPDLWGHTLYGLRSIDAGLLTESVDPFSYTAFGEPWVNHEWLTEYQFGFLWRTTGSVGLWWWRNLLVLVVFVVALLEFRRTHASVPAVVVLIVFNALCLSNFVVFIRPQLATFALFAVTLAILRRHWDGLTRRAIWCLPLLMLLWANLHGGFLAGLGLIGLCWGGTGIMAARDASQRPQFMVLSGVLAASVAATAVNPYGVGLHRMLLYHLGTTQFVREWQPLWSKYQSLALYLPFLIVLLSLSWSRRWKWIDLALLVAVGFQAVMHLRHVSLLAIATMILLPVPLSESLARLFSNLSRQWGGAERRWLRFTAAGLVVLFLGGLQARGVLRMWRQGMLPWDIAIETRSDVPGMPARAIGVMRLEGIHGNLLTDYGWAQYAIWQLHPDCHVAFDGRYRTVYSAKIEREFMQLQSPGEATPGKAAILDGYPTEIALVSRGRGVGKFLSSRPGWVRIYADEQAELFLRDIPRFQKPIRRSRSGMVRAPVVPTWQRFPGNAGEVTGMLTAEHHDDGT